jgi:hypothetical protein
MRAAWFAIVVVLVLAQTSLGGRAVAEGRAPVLDVEGAMGVVVPEQRPVDGNAPVSSVGLARAMLAWELPALAMPATRGYAWALDVGPELGVGFIGNDRRGDGFAQAGLRLNLRFAQREMGLLRVSACGGMWLAARAGVVGDDRSAMVEGDLGWYVWLWQSGWRAGWEMGVIGARNPRDADGTPMSLYGTEPDDMTMIAHGALFVGTSL